MAGFSLSAIAIRRHIGVLMVVLATLVVGVFLLARLQVDLLPAITYPRIGLRVDAPGVAPQVAVEEVTKPLEAALSTTEGVVQVSSQTREGRISINLFFNPGNDLDQALNDATAALNRARSSIPTGLIEEPRLFKFDPSQLPVYEFALESESLPGVALRVFADEELARELSVVPGVAAVDISGGAPEEVRVNLDLQRLQALGVSVQDVLQALRSRNQDLSGGRITGSPGEPLTRTMGRFQSVEEIENLALPLRGESPGLGRRQVYLREVATVTDGTEEPRVLVTLNGRPALKVSIQKQPDANTVAVVDGVKQRLEALRASGLLTDDMILIPTLDESRFIRSSLRNVALAGLAGTGLASLTVLVFLGSLRQTFIIVTAIPLATLVAVILMQLFGLSLNIFSLGGLALGVGIVVDNSIVMLETIAAGAGDARSPSQQLDAAIISSQQVESALVASTLTNLVAVLPFLLLGGFISLLFNELILTISFAVAASLLIALVVVPALASRVLPVGPPSGARFGPLRWFHERFQAATLSYGQVLAQVVRWRLVVIVLAIALLGGGSLWLGRQLPQEILPPINTGQANLRANFPPGTTLEQNRQVMAAVDEILLAQPETEYTFTTSGGALFGAGLNQNVLRGTSTITLKPGTGVQAFAERTTEILQGLNLVNTRLQLSPGRVRGIILSNSPLWGSDIDLLLQSPDPEALQQAGRQVLQALDEQATLARYRPDADPPQPEIQVQPDWSRLADLGFSAETVGLAVQTAVQGTVATRLQRGERLVNIRLQLPPEARQRPEQLAQLPLLTDSGQLVRLADVARLVPGREPAEIQRINQRQILAIAGNLAEEASLGAALAEKDAILSQLDLPPGVTLLPSAARESSRQLQQSLLVLGGLAAFLVFTVMAVQYNSLIDPLVIMLTVPLALAGGIIGLYVTETAVGATVLVGAVLLVGIVVNNAIVMVELANQLHLEYGLSRQAAILKAAPQRLRPILMTTITTVLGLLPLALGVGEGSEFLQPLGVVVFAGLSLATLLTLFLIPCFYVLLHGGEPRPPQFAPRRSRFTIPARGSRPG